VFSRINYKNLKIRFFVEQSFLANSTMVFRHVVKNWRFVIRPFNGHFRIERGILHQKDYFFIYFFGLQKVYWGNLQKNVFFWFFHTSYSQLKWYPRKLELWNFAENSALSQLNVRSTKNTTSVKILIFGAKFQNFKNLSLWLFLWSIRHLKPNFQLPHIFCHNIEFHNIWFFETMNFFF
jgi:hypothetical protein